MKPYIIKELILDEENEESGIQAISFVDFPAIEENFMYFSKEDREMNFATEAGVPIREFYEYTSAPEPEIIEDSHKFCREKAGNIYHISEINSWGRLSSNRQTDYGFNMESNFFTNFNGNVGSFNVNQQIYNCRHWLRRVNSVNEIPQYKRKMNFKSDKRTTDLKINFKVTNKEKREISGLALQSGQFIYRNELDGKNEGYIYFTRDTIRKLKEKYGFNRTITIQHEEDITGSAILLNSWLEESEEDNKTKWFLKYKILNDKLWEAIKDNKIVGYSIEALFAFK